MPLEKRPATDADIPFLLRLRQETMDGYLLASGLPVSDESRLVRVMHAFECAQVLLRDGEPVGLLKLQLPGGRRG